MHCLMVQLRTMAWNCWAAWSELSNLDHPTYCSKREPDLDALSKTDLIVLHDVVEADGRKSFDDLKMPTHSCQIYTNARQPDGIGKRIPIALSY